MAEREPERAPGAAQVEDEGVAAAREGERAAVQAVGSRPGRVDPFSRRMNRMLCIDEVLPDVLRELLRGRKS